MLVDASTRFPEISTMAVEQVWIAGAWRTADASSTFRAENPATGRAIEGEFPVSSWKDCDAALSAAAAAAVELRAMPGRTLRRFP